MRHPMTVLLGTFAIVGLLTACGGGTFADSSAAEKRRGSMSGANGGGSNSDMNGADGSGSINGNGTGADGSNSGGNKPGSANGSGSPASDSIFGGGVGAGGSGSGANGAGGAGGNGTGGNGDGGSGGMGTGGTGNGGSGGTGTGGTGNGGSGGTGTGGTGPGGGGGSGNNGGGSNSGGGGSGNIPNNPLPTDCQPQKILILDFKSGWWAGDGGTTFSEIIKNEITTACPKGQSAVEYHHILRTNTPTQFYNDPSFGYTQAWILSGSVGDNLDIDPNHPGLADVIAKIKAKKTKMFLGSGFGSIDHTNKVGNDVLGITPFATAHKSGAILDISTNGSNVSIINRTTPLAKGNLFTGVTGSIPDAVKASKVEAYSDELVFFNGLTVLSSCNMKSGGTANCVGVARVDGINVVFDSGLQRFYAAFLAGEDGVKQYLRNIVRALSL